MLCIVYGDDNSSGCRFSGFRCRCWFSHSLVDFDTSFRKEHAAAIFCVMELGYTGRQYRDTYVTQIMEATSSSETYQPITLHCVKTQLLDNTYVLVLVLILIYLLTTIGLTPGGSSTVHIYTQTIHRRTQLTTFVGRLSGNRNQSGQNNINDELIA